MGDTSELAAEQAHVDHAYARLLVRRGLVDELGEDVVNSSPGARLERDEREAVRARWNRELRLGDLPLCFGRIDMVGADTWHIGRIGVDDEGGDRLVVDWRAPVAEPFYRATPNAPAGVIRRRHLRCRAATVLGLDDELFGSAGDDDSNGMVVVGEAALLRTLGRRRTGRMGDIVATIQSEQDVIIRSRLDEALVVQGGPGTGKTAVALHRIAYLLHTHREELEAKGVLLVGPSATFLRYIERVLPSLGEQGATLRTTATLHRNSAPAGIDGPETARLKGDVRMAEVLARAVRDRQRPLAKTATIPFGAYPLRITADVSRQLVDRARSRPGPHNERRADFERAVLTYLYRYYVAVVERAERAGQQPAAPVERAEFVDRIRRQRDARAVLDRMWPVLTPPQLLADLFGHAPLLRQAAGGLLTEDEQRRLLRHNGDSGATTEADDALLDELDVHLGRPPGPRRVRVANEDLEYMADRVIEGVAADADISLSASMRADIRERIVNEQVAVEAPERARTVGRTYGHVVVDEAQDVTPMQWRMIARRCPAASFTIVGDVGQASGVSALGWDDVLDIVAPDRRRRVVELTVNYRTPAEVMDLAGRILTAAAPHLVPPTSVRDSGRPPVVRRVDAIDVAGAAARAAAEMLVEFGSGTFALIADESLHARLRVALDGIDSTRARGHEPLDDPVALLTPTRTKGLEFDGVVVAEPAQIVGTSGSGLLALYVAITRTTEALTIVHADPLPAPLEPQTGEAAQA